MAQSVIAVTCPSNVAGIVTFTLDHPYLIGDSVCVVNPVIADDKLSIKTDETSYDAGQISLWLHFKIDSSHALFDICAQRKIDCFDLIYWIESQTNLTPFELLTEQEIQTECDQSPLKKRNVIKKCFEWSLFIITSPFWIPGMIIGYILASADGKFTPIYQAERCGKGNRTFMLTKFRSMKLNSYSQTGAYSMPNDDRITAVGKILRASKLDELPQLLEFVRGDLALIGPRPELWSNINNHLSSLIQGYAHRHVVDTGITGWAQVVAGYPFDVTGFIKRHSCDLYYIRNWSLLLDIRVLIKTVGIIFSKFFGSKSYVNHANDWDNRRRISLELRRTGQCIEVDIARQELTLYRLYFDKDVSYPQKLEKTSYQVSTSELGVGNVENSFQTPFGSHMITDKIGENEPLGRIFTARVPTDNLQLATKQDMGDLITTRILRLGGIEPGVNKGASVDTYSRFIYIHGTPYEHTLGVPSSKGCIRMSNQNIVELFSEINTNSMVIIAQK